MPQDNFPWTRSGEEDELPLASTTEPGIVKAGVHIAQLTAAPTQADFNNLLTVLQNAGILASS